MRDWMGSLGFRTVLFLGLCAAPLACQSQPEAGDSASMEDAAETATAGSALTLSDVSREVIAGDIAHYTFVLRLGDTPSAELAIHRVVRERSPWAPRKSGHAIVLLHGDFANFPSTFLSPGEGAPSPASRGLAPYLAGQDIDVWGIDRRWTRAPIDTTDFSDWPSMGLAQEIDDTEQAVAFVCGVRAVTGHGTGRVILGGFSHGGQLAYEVVAAETQKPAFERHIKALVPIDIYDAPPADEDARQGACDNRDFEVDAVAQGFPVSDNTFFAQAADLDRTAPDDPSPFFPNRTNHGGLLNFMARTWVFFFPTANYHLAGAFLSGNTATSYRWSPQARIDDWLGAAPPYQSMQEGADLDAIWCGDGPRPVPDHLADIHVPIFYLGAAGGFGDSGLPTLALTGSGDVTSLVIRRLPAADERQDFGHGDLLFSDDAPTLAWAPLTSWIKSH